MMFSDFTGENYSSISIFLLDEGLIKTSFRGTEISLLGAVSML